MFKTFPLLVERNGSLVPVRTIQAPAHPSLRNRVLSAWLKQEDAKRNADPLLTRIIPDREQGAFFVVLHAQPQA